LISLSNIHFVATLKTNCILRFSTTWTKNTNLKYEGKFHEIAINRQNSKSMQIETSYERVIVHPSIIQNKISLFQHVSHAVLPCFYKGSSNTLLHDTVLHRDDHNFLVVMYKFACIVHFHPDMAASNNNKINLDEAWSSKGITSRDVHWPKKIILLTRIRSWTIMWSSQLSTE
jgi:hypothetical protein